MDQTLVFLKDNREILEVALILLFAFSSKVREVIATVSEMLQSASTTNDDVAKKKAISLLKRKLPFLAFIPDFVLGAIIQWFFNQMKKQANQEVAEIKQWNSKSASA